jgi:hypothetical protein
MQSGPYSAYGHWTYLCLLYTAQCTIHIFAFIFHLHIFLLVSEIAKLFNALAITTVVNELAI